MCVCVCVCVCVCKLKQSRYRPRVVQRVPGRIPDFMTTAQIGSKVVSLTPAAFTLRICSWYSFLLEAESTPGP